MYILEDHDIISNDILNEAYYGITRDLQSMINTLHAFREKHMVDNSSIGLDYSSTLPSSINTDPDLIKFNRQMEDFFGFYIFNLRVITRGVVNGYTISAPTRSSHRLTKKDLTKGKNGIMYKKSSGVRCCVFIYAGIMLNPDFTDREIMAIILHEVGHNFSVFESKTITVDVCISRLLKPLTVLINLIVSIIFLDGEGLTITLLYSGDKEYDFYYKTMDKIYKSDAFRTIYDSLSSFSHTMKDAFLMVDSFLSRLSVATYPVALIKTFIRQLKNVSILQLVSGYKNEKIADSFPAMYGLAPDLSVALDKIGKYQIGGPKGLDTKAADKIPVFSHLVDIEDCAAEFLLSLLDPHPANGARISNELKYINSELQRSDLDPKMKKDLLEQQKEMEKYMSEIYAKIESSDPRLFKQVYKLTMLKLFDGDVRQAITNIIDKDDKYNKKYDNLISKVPDNFV